MGGREPRRAEIAHRGLARVNAAPNRPLAMELSQTLFLIFAIAQYSDTATRPHSLPLTQQLRAIVEILQGAGRGWP